LEFEETLNAALDKPLTGNPRNDPEVKIFAPVQICGTVGKADVKKCWNLKKYEGLFQ
jgi:hypothetical protein